MDPLRDHRIKKSSSPVRQRYILGIFNDRKTVLKCISRLKRYPFSDSDLFLSVSNPERAHEPTFMRIRKMTKNPETAITGFGIGALTGITLGVGMGLGLVPGMSASDAMGPFISALFGLFFGGSLGAAIGAYIGSKIPEEDAKDFEKSLKQKEILLSVPVNNRREEHQTEKVFQEFGASRILMNDEKSRFEDSTLLILNRGTHADQTT